MNKEFFYEMIGTESVSGCELPLQRKIAAYMRDQGVEVRTDYTGNVISVLNPESKNKVLLCGHADEIGFRVTHITDQGYLKVCRAGGIYLNLILGKRVTVLGRKRLVGVMGVPGDKRAADSKFDFTDLFVDCGFKDKAEAEQYVKPGDPITYTYTIDELQNDLVAGRALDNRMGAYAVTHALLRAREKGCKVGVYAATTVGEETTMRGAVWAAEEVRPTMAIAVDVTYTCDCPGTNPESYGDISLNGGPVISRSSYANEPMIKRLEAAGAALGLHLQYETNGGNCGTDGDKLNVSAAGIPTAVVSIPLRYMHSPSEVGSLRDLDQVVELLAEFLCRLDEAWRPDPFQMEE